LGVCFLPHTQAAPSASYLHREEQKATKQGRLAKHSSMNEVYSKATSKKKKKKFSTCVFFFLSWIAREELVPKRLDQGMGQHRSHPPLHHKGMCRIIESIGKDL